MLWLLAIYVLSDWDLCIFYKDRRSASFIGVILGVTFGLVIGSVWIVLTHSFSYLRAAKIREYVELLFLLVLIFGGWKMFTTYL